MSERLSGNQLRYLQNAGEGDHITLDGLTFTVKCTGMAQMEPFTICEVALPPYESGPIAHVHWQSTEWLYVLTGAVAFTLNHETFMARPSCSILVPPGVAHTYWNPTASAATLLCHTSQPDFVNYLQALAALAPADGADSPVGQSELLALAARHDQFPPESMAFGKGT